MNVHVVTNEKSHEEQFKQIIMNYFKKLEENMEHPLNIKVEEMSLCFHVTIITFSNKKLIKVHSKDPNLKHALYLAKERLVKKLKKQKGSIVLVSVLPQEEKKNGETEEVIEHKIIDIKPMSLEEALLQVKMFNRRAFMFLRADTNRMCMIYKRKDDHYVLIETN